MKRLLLFIASAAVLAGCTSKEPVVTPDGSADASGLAIKSLTITSGETVTVPGDIAFEVAVADAVQKLSTLEVSVKLGDKVLATASFRTSGNEASVNDKISVPFLAGMAEGSSLTVTFEAINVSGASVKEDETIRLVRPTLPDELYLIINDMPYEMVRQPANPDVYETDKGDFQSIVSAFVASSQDPSTAAFLWGASEEVNVGEICAFSGATGISVSYPSYIVEKYTFDTVSFKVGVEGTELKVSVNGTPLYPTDGLLYASINFTKGAEVALEGIDDLANAWNRDFFSYEGGKLTFLRESGQYDVFYSPKYNYIWIAKMQAVAPECLWIIGHGFTQSPVWHEDFSLADGSWDVVDITRMGYAVPIGEDKYQCSLYLNDRHEWESFEFEVYSDLEWGKEKGFGGTSLSGFTKGVKLSGAKDGKSGLTSDMGFQPGYYTLIFDNATGEINLDRKSDWTDTGTSGVYVNGVELDVAEDCYYANIPFTQGGEVTISGLSDLSGAIHRDFFSYSGGKITFLAKTGTWFVQYYPRYNYFWISSEGMTYPDCIYILGDGKFAAPLYDDADDSVLWTGDGWNRFAPYFIVAPKIGDTYQATMSMSTSCKGWRVLLEFYTDLVWNQSAETAPTTLSGPAADRFYINQEKHWLCGIDEPGDPFQPGNYRMVITPSASGADVNITKLD